MSELPTLRELPNREALQWLLEHSAFVQSVALRHNEKHPDSPYTQDLVASLSRYARFFTKTGVKVEYKFAKGQSDGRLFAIAPSMQKFPRQIREMLQHGLCIDADFSNCAPSILDQMCDKLGIKHPRLKRYVADRSKVYAVMEETHGMAASKVKSLVSKLLFGGCLPQHLNCDPW